jgi:23S rRNA maturation mini-RNase III
MIETMSEENKRHEKALEDGSRRDQLKDLEEEMKELFDLPEDAIKHIVRKADFDNREKPFDNVEKEAYDLATFSEIISGFVKLDINDKITRLLRRRNQLLRKENRRRLACCFVDNWG